MNSTDRVKKFREKQKQNGKLSYDPVKKAEYKRNRNKDNKALKWLDKYIAADEKGKQKLVKELSPPPGPFKLKTNT